ncbi:probable beta-1,4-xylosyltransferase IRX9H [Cucurbita maxima]|uniref:Glycosyltransferases n=1 Tax=Cucurbita maxima TaxID=3661 RepID=A0A6J1IN64_CUCMA|nr:probable beta-1,4-xylosyltransferase IRX9H [Cucurbita maxima]
MASIRRTLSPVPRPGASMNGEACSVGSPLCRSSLSPQTYPQSTGLHDSLFNSLKTQAATLGIYSPRSSRPIDKSKSKVPVWKRAMFHFFMCFVIGFLAGFTPFASSNLSMNVMSEYQAFQFDRISTDENSVPQNSSSSTNTKSSPTQSEVLMHNNVSYDNLDSLVIARELEPRKLLIIVTSTSAHPLQSYYLNRLAHTLKLVQPPLLWIVVEMFSQSDETAAVLRSTGIMYRHIVCNKNLTDMRDGRVHQRNLALSHIETHRLDGIVYFADENNVYLVDLFEQMREIRRFGTWPVAKLLGGASRSILEGPICNGSLVIGWHVYESSMRLRRFHAEISGFAFNSTILWDPERWRRRTLEPVRQLDTIRDGLQASDFIEQIVEDESQMEGLLEDCSRIMVWNINFKPSSAVYPHKWLMKNILDVTASLT